MACCRPLQARQISHKLRTAPNVICFWLPGPPPPPHFLFCKSLPPAALAKMHVFAKAARYLEAYGATLAAGNVAGNVAAGHTVETW